MDAHAKSEVNGNNHGVKDINSKDPDAMNDSAPPNDVDFAQLTSSLKNQLAHFRVFADDDSASDCSDLHKKYEVKLGDIFLLRQDNGFGKVPVCVFVTKLSMSSSTLTFLGEDEGLIQVKFSNETWLGEYDQAMIFRIGRNGIVHHASDGKYTSRLYLHGREGILVPGSFVTMSQRLELSRDQYKIKNGWFDNQEDQDRAMSRPQSNEESIIDQVLAGLIFIFVTERLRAHEANINDNEDGESSSSSEDIDCSFLSKSVCPLRASEKNEDIPKDDMSDQPGFLQGMLVCVDVDDKQERDSLISTINVLGGHICTKDASDLYANMVISKHISQFTMDCNNNNRSVMIVRPGWLQAMCHAHENNMLDHRTMLTIDKSHSLFCVPEKSTLDDHVAASVELMSTSSAYQASTHNHSTPARNNSQSVSSQRFKNKSSHKHHSLNSSPTGYSPAKKRGTSDKTLSRDEEPLVKEVSVDRPPSVHRQQNAIQYFADVDEEPFAHGEHTEQEIVVPPGELGFSMRVNPVTGGVEVNSVSDQNISLNVNDVITKLNGVEMPNGVTMGGLPSINLMFQMCGRSERILVVDRYLTILEPLKSFPTTSNQAFMDSTNLSPNMRTGSASMNDVIGRNLSEHFAAMPSPSNDIDFVDLQASTNTQWLSSPTLDWQLPGSTLFDEDNASSQTGPTSASTPDANSLKKIQAQTSPQAEAGCLFALLTNDIINAYSPGWMIMADGCFEVKHPNPIGTHTPRLMSPQELRGVLGKQGCVPTHIPIYNRTNGKTGDVSRHGGKYGGKYELIQEFYCGGIGCGCQFKMKICRVNVNGITGIVSYQKTMSIDGTEIPMPHTGHKKLPYFNQKTFGKKCKKEFQETVARQSVKFKHPQYPTLEQKERVVEVYRRNNKWNVVIQDMFSDPKMKMHTCQQGKLGRKRLKTCLVDLMKNRGGLAKYKNDIGLSSPKMSVKDAGQILDRLRDTPLGVQSRRVFLVGEDDHDFFTSQGWEIIWESLFVIDHNFGSNHSGKFFILCSANDALATAIEAAKMFPDNKVQLEMDFYKIKGVNFQVGHVGLCDFKRSYWLQNFIVCESENFFNSLKLLQAAVDIVEQANGVVEFVLVDGGLALEAAVNQMNVTQKEKDMLIMILRHCLAHVGRMPNSRGGGKRGGNGSLCKYLLKNGVKYPMMCKIMSLVFMLNYIPPDGKTFRVAMNLLISEYENEIPEDALVHIRKTYWDGDKPELIGGRAVGRQGMPGSSQAVERWGREPKEILEAYVLTPEQRHNPLYLLNAIATSISTRESPSTAFVSSPMRSDENFNHIRKIAERKRISGGGFRADYIYAIITVGDGDIIRAREVDVIKDLISLVDVIGDPSKSFYVYFASGGNLNTTAKAMKADDAQFTDNCPYNQSGYGGVGGGANRAPIDHNRTDEEYWTKFVNYHATLAERRQLRKMIIQSWISDTLEAKPGETTYEYLQRRGSRMAQCGDRLVDKEKELNKKGGKGNRGRNNNNRVAAAPTLEEKLEKEKDWEKWIGELSKQAVVDSTSDELSEDCGDDNIGLVLGEDATILDIRDILGDHLAQVQELKFNETEKESVRWMQKASNVTSPRELGMFQKIHINAETKSVMCWCENCNRSGRCFWKDTFRAIQFGINPETEFQNMKDASLGWTNIIKHAIDVIKFYVREIEEEDK